MNKKVDIQYQSESNECGLACIAMLSTYLGRECWLENIRSRFVPSGRGTSAETLVQIARELGFLASAVRFKGTRLDSTHLPVIIHWNSNHYVILEKINDVQAVVVDPSLGRRVVRKLEFDKCFSGVLITIQPPSSAKENRPKRLHTSRFKRLLPVLRFLGCKELRSAKTLWIFLLVLLTELLGLTSPIFVSRAFGLASERISDMAPPLIQLVIIFISINLIQGAALYARGFLIIQISGKLLSRWTELSYQHLLSLPLSFFLSRSVGGITSRLSSLRSLQTLLTGRFVTAGLDLSVALVAMIVAWHYAPWAVTVILIAMAIYATARHVTNKKSAFYTEMSLVQLAQQDAEVIESVKGIATLKSGLKTEDRVIRYRDMVHKSIEYQNLSQRFSIGIDALANIFVGIQRTVVISLGVYFIAHGSFNVAYLAALLTYLDILSSRVNRLIDTSSDFSNVLLHLSRLRDVVHAKPESTSSLCIPSSQMLTIQPGVPHLALKQLSFRQPGSNCDLFGLVSLNVYANERVAITGRSGQGKTTLLMIASGLIKATSGTVEVDGKTINEIGYERFRERIGLVLQEDYLFPGSILENISSFHSKPSHEWAIECCKSACIHEEVQALPMGLLTQVADAGRNFSGGQRQRICLARALYKRPRILILDESSSHLDSETERSINEKLKYLKLAILSVAHREETINYADRVFNLKDGVLELIRTSSSSQISQLRGIA